MKKLTILMLILSSFAVVKAEQISKSQAAAIAGKYLPAIESETAQPMKKAVGVNQSAPEYYIFNAEDGNGFVIVSGDDELTEVVGYSTTGTFKVSEDMPVAIRTYLSDYSNYVNAVRSGEAKPIKQSFAPAPVVGPLVKTKWDQGFPFNMHAPYDRIVKDNCPIGCVATAFAQLMNYHKWPEKGTGTRSYRSDYGYHSVNFANSTYDWQNMIDEYNRYQVPSGDIVNEFTDAQAKAVGKLMWDCAVSVNMQFAADASGSTEGDVVWACSKYFYYDVEILYRSGTIKNQFVDRIKSYLDKSTPLMFCGTGSLGGHAFVCDGYDANNYLHINWGWSGLSDGYFNVDMMNPDNLGTGGGAGGFNQNQVVVAMTPNKTGSMGKEGQATLFLLGKEFNSNGFFKTDATLVKKGDPFTVKAYFLMNQAASAKSWELSAGIYDTEGKRVAMSSDVSLIRNLPSYYQDTRTHVFNITEAVKGLPEGTYFVKPICREIRNAEKFDWIYVASQEFVTITVQGNNIVVGNLPKTIEMTSVITSDSPEYLVGEKAQFKATFKNNSDEVAMGNVKFLVTDAVTNFKKKTFSQSLSIAPLGTTEMVFSLDMTTPPFAVGNKYKVAYYTYSSTKGDQTMASFPKDNGCVISLVEKKGGVSQLEASSVSVYPNPATDFVKVNVDAEIVAIELYNAGGSLVKKVAGTNEISVSDCPAGYYLVNVITESGSLRKSVIVK